MYKKGKQLKTSFSDMGQNVKNNSVARDLPPTGSEANTTKTFLHLPLPTIFWF